MRINKEERKFFSYDNKRKVKKNTFLFEKKIENKKNLPNQLDEGVHEHHLKFAKLLLYVESDLKTF